MTKVENRYDRTRVFPSNRLGHLYDARGRVASTATIPTKFQTIVITNDEKKGFNSGSKRFELQQGNDSPGPAKYTTPSYLSTENNASYSTKGLGGFASKSKRFPVELNPDCFAGPGQYNPEIKGGHDFNRAKCSANFAKAIANTNHSKKFKTPAPNTYHMTAAVTGKTKPGINSGTHPPFFSTTIRERKTINAANPAPNLYEICDTKDTRATQAPFKSKTQRSQLTNGVHLNPGPGAYNPFEPQHMVKKNRLPRKHYLCIAAPAMDMPESLPPPGPAQYNVVDYEGPKREYITNSVFKSTTNRWSNVEEPNSNPGPGTYNPKRTSTNFIHNGDNKWL